MLHYGATNTSKWQKRSRSSPARARNPHCSLRRCPTAITPIPNARAAERAGTRNCPVRYACAPRSPASRTRASGHRADNGNSRYPYPAVRNGVFMPAENRINGCQNIRKRLRLNVADHAKRASVLCAENLRAAQEQGIGETRAVTGRQILIERQMIKQDACIFQRDWRRSYPFCITL